MAAEKAAPLPLSVVFVKEEEEKQHAPADPLFLPGVRDVIKWALFNAGCFVFSIAYALIVTSISHPPSWLLPGMDAAEPKEVTAAAAHVVHMLGVLWSVCVGSQAAAGTLALVLPRLRLLLAYAALVATAAGHCMWVGVYVAPGPPRGGRFWDGVGCVVFFVCGVIDLLCFRGLFLRGGKRRRSRDLHGTAQAPS